MDMFYVILIYLQLVNLTAFAAFGVDKWKARRNRWRIPEAALMTLAVIGGSIGALAGMYLFRHKTRHHKFTIGVPAILILQVGFCLCLFWAVSF